MIRIETKQHSNGVWSAYVKVEDGQSLEDYYQCADTKEQAVEWLVNELKDLRNELDALIQKEGSNERTS